jgi:hypothetical protein
MKKPDDLNEFIIFWKIGIYVDDSDVPTLAKSIKASFPFNDHVSVVVIGRLSSVWVYSILYSGEPDDVVKGPEIIRWKSLYWDSRIEILALPKSIRDGLEECDFKTEIIRLGRNPESRLELDTKPTIKFLSNCIFSQFEGYWIFIP